MRTVNVPILLIVRLCTAIHAPSTGGQLIMIWRWHDINVESVFVEMNKAYQKQI